MKRRIAFIFALALCAALLCAGAFADGGVEYMAWDEAQSELVEKPIAAHVKR